MQHVERLQITDVSASVFESERGLLHSVHLVFGESEHECFMEVLGSDVANAELWR